jgi:hypothetical protein
MLKKCFTPAIKAQEGDEESKHPWESNSFAPCIYDGASEDFDALLTFLKRRLFMQTLKSIFTFSRHAWAKQTVVQTLKKVYLEK